MTERERLEETLQGLSANMRTLTEQRDRLITHAVAIGISKHRIHVLTGIARTTIDRIITKEQS